MDGENIIYCLLRDHDRLDRLGNPGEIDLLIQGNQIGRLREPLARLGFISLPNWGHKPHHFFVAYDEGYDSWLKLDIVTEIAYGAPDHVLRTTLGAGCLKNRRRVDSVFIPSPEDELVTLLLHCVLDKGRFSLHGQSRLRALRRQVTDEGYISALLVSYWSPTITWPQLVELIDAENWAALLAAREVVAGRMANHNRLGTLGRKLRDRILRKSNRWAVLGQLHPPSVALLAPDGAGKSTLAVGVQESFYFPVHSVYMGLYDSRNKKESMHLPIPGLGFVRRLVTQWRRYLSARYHQARGQLVIFDRYTYDALVPPRQPLNWPRQVRRWLLAHACPAPDLVIMLDAPGETLFDRKGEHTPSFLERQRQSYLQLSDRLPQMTVVDATKSAECIRREVTGLIWQRYTERSSDFGG